ncbi:CLUMA_CG015090, isoform B [Clunio marinus]|uniref:Cleavage and polyadenylation specificity factor subunit 6 n=1 Tax=Clunio marinus TaxID=568069 RepID=A0A1J1IQ96_9DIPT|nr:CLUMA_CG015090, isoform B [Clunio marinus]
MADNVDSDLLYDDFQDNDRKEFNDENYDQGDDLYDDVLSTSNNISNNDNNASQEHNVETETNGSYQGNMHHIARRFQLYIGNLTWWTTDQDIQDAVAGIGVNDFQEVKFFENRANGQSKGFCVITLGSEPSMRIVMENLPKKELNGQNPVVTLPTKQALNQFESQQKTRPTPPAPPNNQKPGMGGMGMGMGGMPMGQNIPQHNMNPQRMMNPNPMMRGPNPMMQNAPMQNPMQQRMPGNGPPPMNHPNGPPMNQQMPPRFQNNWNGPPRGQMGPNGMGPNRPPMNMNPMNMNQRPMGMNMPPRGPRPDWNNRPPMHPGNFNPPQQGMNMPPRGPPQMPLNQPAPHVNPAFFNQNNMGQGPPMQQSMVGAPQHFNQQGPRPGMWPVSGPNKMPGPSFDVSQANSQPPVSEAEFEEIMGRNRTVSSSAIARAVSDAAACEYASAIETLATAISLIKQSKVANDERCKILITSLQDTLQGIEAKSFNRRSERSRSRERRRRRERSNSRTYRRSRSREHREHRERGRDDENYHSSSRENRERSRSRERGNAEHYRGDESSSRRPRKSPEAGDSNSENFKRSYEERNRDSDRYRGSDRERETRTRH